MSQFNDRSRLTDSDDTLSHIQAYDLKGTGFVYHELPTIYPLCFIL